MTFISGVRGGFQRMRGGYGMRGPRPGYMGDGRGMRGPPFQPRPPFYPSPYPGMPPMGMPPMAHQMPVQQTPQQQAERLKKVPLHILFFFRSNCILIDLSCGAF